MMPDFYKPEQKLPKSPYRVRFILLVLILGLFLSGCAEWVTPVLNLIAPTSTKDPTQSVLTQEPQVTPSPTFEPLSTMSGSMELTIWVPPQFNPGSGTQAGNLLQGRLDEFMKENPGVIINVRVKTSTGPGSLVEALTSASAAASQAVPSIVALNRSDLESAALKGLIYPLGGLTQELEDGDWYPYARQMAEIETSDFGLPFAGNALLMVFRSTSTGNLTPTTWDEVLSFGLPILFQVDDSQALMTLDLYLSAGGEIQNDQGRPALQLDPLIQTLTVYENGARRGSFPPSITQYQTSGQAWQAFEENQANWVVTWSTNYLSEAPEDAQAVMLPSLGEKPYTLATGWVWALSDPDPERREVSMRLAEFLVDSSFLMEWNPASGFLPTRPTVLAGWENQNDQVLINQMVQAAQIRPPNELIAGLGPILRDASLEVIKGQNTAAGSAQSALDRLGTP